MTRRGQILFFLPALLVFLVFVLLPSTQTLIDSFYSHQGIKHPFVGTLYYRYAVTDPAFHQSLGNNLKYLLWTLLFEVAAGLALAVGLEKNTRFNNFLRVAFFSPAVLSMVVVGLVFGFLFKDGVGVLPGMLNEGRALLTISVISGWASAGFFMVIFLAGLANVPEDVLEAARLDGASARQTFWRIKLPLLKAWMHDYCYLGTPLISAHDDPVRIWTAVAGVLRRVRPAPLLVIQSHAGDGPVAAALRRADAQAGLGVQHSTVTQRGFVHRRADPTYASKWVAKKHLANLARRRRQLSRTLGCPVDTVDRAAAGLDATSRFVRPNLYVILRVRKMSCHHALPGISARSR